MLTEMLIKNFVLIDELRLEFDSGLNVLTGETGAGKSIIIDALGLVIGERIQEDFLRDPNQKAMVEAVFELPQQKELRQFLQEQGLAETGDDQLIISRVIAPNGRSTARINGRTVTVSTLKEVAPYLVDLHVQGEQHNFLQTDTYLDMLDAFDPRIQPLRTQVEEKYRQLQNLTRQLEALRDDEQNKLQRLDFLEFQINEIEKAQLVSGEDQELTVKRQRIRNANRLDEVCQRMLGDLYRSEESYSAYDLLSSALEAAQGIKDDEFFASLTEPLQEMLVTIQDMAASVASFQDELDFDPVLLEEIEQRLYTIERLKSKYGESVDEILAHLQQAYEERNQLEMSSERQQVLEEEIQQLQQQYDETAGRLTELRSETAAVLEKEILAELSQLNMPHIRLEIRLEGRSTPGPQGRDRVELWFSANPGEDLRPLVRTVSGGELSRVILAIKTALADTYQVPTLIFDEIDVGVGGTSLTAMARKLKQLSDAHQVILVTHAPQVAAYAGVHHFIQKEVYDGQTLTRVSLLQGEERVAELARMLSGETITNITLQHAREMIANANN
ncbi:MAG: DNA repair protein RecN [Syntrophomonadaceae bacterium]|nr:DNA repair protein RecN [Syntrophomonadaceae bacterium]